MGRGKDTRVAIIGGGLSGITLAINLKKRLGLENFTIYEKMAEPGGTWRDNTYPGCACDVPAHWYSLSTEQNPNWSAKYAPQPEIFAYWRKIHSKHNLTDHTSYNSTFKKAVWDGQRQVYVISFETTSNPDHKYDVEAEVLVSCIGGFSTPLDAPPSLPGLTDFEGERFHSARWNHNVDLNNKTVGVIGNGCSGAQFFPVLVEKYPNSKFISFSRTPAWFFPRDQRNYSSFEKWVFRWVPGVMNTYRSTMAAILDGRFIVWLTHAAMIRNYAELVATNHIKNTAPEKYHEYLIPKYPFGCKRIILDPGYLEALNAPNTELVTDRIEKITEKGILGKSGKEYPLDVIILATGFDVSARGLGINVVGTHGKTLTEQWEEQDGPQAYLGTTVAGFPNFFTVLGPNVATGHASVISSTESQVNYICEMIKPIYKGRATSFELKTDAEDRYQRQLTKRANKTVWAGCDSYYKLANGKIIATFPGTLTEFWWRTRKPNFEHYLQKGGKASIIGNVAFRERIAWVFRTFLYLYAFFAIRRYGFRRLGLEAGIFAMMRYQELRQRIMAR